jgi:hypothetical protein
MVLFVCGGDHSYGIADWHTAKDGRKKIISRRYSDDHCLGRSSFGLLIRSFAIWRLWLCWRLPPNTVSAIQLLLISPKSNK